MKTWTPCWKRFFASVEKTITTTKKTSLLSLTSYFWRTLVDAIFSWKKKSAAYLESLADPAMQAGKCWKIMRVHNLGQTDLWDHNPPWRLIPREGRLNIRKFHFFRTLSFSSSFFYYFPIKPVSHYDITTSISITAERTHTTHKYRQKNRKNKSFCSSWACTYVSASWERHAVSICMSIRESPPFFCHCFEEYGTKSRAIIAHAYLLVL